MAKIFRAIREKLLSDGKGSKYLRYAVGEIVLVVIGILIALQIDTIYANYQVRKTEVKYLEEIRDNLRFDLKDIQFNIDFNNERLNSNEIVLQYLNEEVPYSDTIGFHLSNVIYTTRTLPNSSAYETVKSRGIDIISNDSLRQQITTLYDFRYKNIIDFETKDDHEYQFRLFLPELVKAVDFVAVWENGKPNDPKAVLKNSQLKNVIVLNIHLRKYMIRNYNALLEHVQNTIGSIEMELNIAGR